MNTRKIERNNIHYEVPGDFAAVAAQEFKQLDSLQVEHQKTKSKLDELNEEKKQLEADKEELCGKCDSYEEIIDFALPLLKEQGYRWDSEDGVFYQEDMKKKDSSEEDYEDISDDEKEEKKENKKDSVEDLLTVWREAETLVPGIKYDSSYTVADVQQVVCQHLDSKINFDGKSSEYIAGHYNALKTFKTQNTTKTDSNPHLRNLDAVIDRADSINKQSSISDRARLRMDNYKKPLSISKRVNY